jgi:aspartate/methionine/tyrosine aminotransferase
VGGRAQVGVTAIPVSAFYSRGHASLARDLVRFCFCKTEGLLAEAERRLSAHPALARRR